MQHLCLVRGLLVALATAPLVSFGQTTSVTPTEIPDLLANPEIGWETFQSISSSGATTYITANPANVAQRSWIPTTVMYVRPSWAEMEPQEGVLSNWLDNALAAAAAMGQKVALRPGVTVRWPAGANAVPQWVKNVTTGYTMSDGYYVPEWDDPVFLQKVTDFIKLLGAKYDGDSRLAEIDIGTVGTAENEWHMSPYWENTSIPLDERDMPSQATEQAIIDAYAAAFPHHKLIGLINSGGASTSNNSNPALSYAGSKGAGWRGDCYGDTKFAMVNPYPTYVDMWGLSGNWRTAVVAFESCYTMAQWPSQGYRSYRAIFNYGLNAHASLINDKSATLPADTTTVTNPDGTTSTFQAELTRFLQRLGYRFVLGKIDYPAQAASGSTIPISMQWQNVGSAPCYKPNYRVGYRFRGAAGDDHIVVGQVDPCTWMPGDLGYMPDGNYLNNPVDLPRGSINTVNESVVVPSGLASGTYSVAIGIVDQATSQPVLRLAVAGRDSQGWYPLNTITIGGASTTTSDTQSPSQPTGLTAAAASSSQINLAWNASTDNVGVAGYRIYRNGSQVATVSGKTSFGDGSLAASTTYTYTVAAYDAAGNVSAQSAAASATTPAASVVTSSGIRRVQQNAVPGTAVASVSASFPSNNSAGNLIVAFVRMSSTTQTVTLTDSAGNTYVEAARQMQTSDGHQTHLFYAKNIKGSANTVTARFSAANNHPWLAIFEYSGLSTINPLDKITTAQGHSKTPSAGMTAVTSYANELVISGIGMPASYAGSVSNGSGYAMIAQDTGTSRSAAENTVAGVSTSFNPSFSTASTVNWSAITATFH